MSGAVNGAGAGIVELLAGGAGAEWARRIEAFRRLVREYGATIPEHMCAQGLERELAELPGRYDLPRGGMWLAEVGGEAVGTVALRPFDDDTGEIKRLYVRPAHRGGGWGRRLVLGVTVLTSMDKASLAELGGETDVTRQVERLARLAVNARLRGLVCSPLELPTLRAVLPASVQMVTPRIRTGAEKADDQKPTLSPAEAVRVGADWLMVGRPITAAADPVAAAQAILQGVRGLPANPRLA